MSASVMAGETRQRHSATPLVGYVATSTAFEVIEARDRLIIRLSRSTYLLVLGGSALVGPLITLAFWLAPERVSPHMPVVIKAVLVAAVVAGWLWFLRSLVTRPRVEIAYDSGDIRYFLRGSRPARIIPRANIAAVEIEEDVHRGEWTRYPNKVLTVITTDGERIRICASPDAELITSLARRFATLTHNRTVQNSTEQVTQ